MLLKFVDATSATASFIETNLERVERVIERAVERRIPVKLTTPALGPPESKTKAEIDPKIMENPVVAEAIGLFDATIHSVRSLSTKDSATPSARNKPEGDSNDV